VAAQQRQHNMLAPLRVLQVVPLLLAVCSAETSETSLHQEVAAEVATPQRAWPHASGIAVNETGVMSEQVGKEAPARSSLRGANDVAATAWHVRFLTYNVYYANLAGRAREIARGIAQVAPEIAALQESIQDRALIVEHLKKITGQQWKLSTPPDGCVWYWDGAIIYRSDIWEELGNGRVPYGGGGCYSESLRALNWVALRRWSDRKGVLVYGTHPICCRGDWPILEAVQLISREMAAGQQRWGFPIVLMADMNTGYYEPSQKTLREGFANAFGVDWRIPLKFNDAYAQTHPGQPNPSTIPPAQVRLDYIYSQQWPSNLGQVVGSQVWQWLPGGSDHRAVSADIILA